jgi:hypothetical protein
MTRLMALDSLSVGGVDVQLVKVDLFRGRAGQLV